MNDSDRIAARWLTVFAAAGLILSLVSFFLYASGAVFSPTPPERSAAAWHLPVQEYLKTLGRENGALWMYDGGDAYRLSTAALTVLASTALPALLALTLYWWRRRDRLYSAMALVICGVLVLAALS